MSGAEPDMPFTLLSRPRDKHGRVVPWFVAMVDGQWDFRVQRNEAVAQAVTGRLCWMCGTPLGRYGTFVIGPMCAVNRNTAEPPCHEHCAEYAVKVCPFLTRPDMRRRDVPGETYSPGVMLTRNPGVTLLWTSQQWTPWTPDGRGLLFDVGDPHHVTWWAEGRMATTAEALSAIDSGLPLLLNEARAEGPEAVTEFDAMVAAAMTLLPREAVSS